MLDSTGIFDVNALAERKPTLWRYCEALGIDNKENIVSLGEGLTPLVPRRLNGFPVMLKVDYLCPTGSYKDRGSTVMISKLKEWGVREIVEDSSGKAGASIAAYAAIAGIGAKIYVPAAPRLAKQRRLKSTAPISSRYRAPARTRQKPPEPPLETIFMPATTGVPIS